MIPKEFFLASFFKKGRNEVQKLSHAKLPRRSKRQNDSGFKLNIFFLRTSKYQMNLLKNSILKAAAETNFVKALFATAW
jgi:hypothetical protein